MKSHEESNSQFIAQLAKICENDRGHAASLRRYWSATTEHQALPILGRLGAIGDDRKSTVAALYAVHPAHAEGMGIGRAAIRLGERKDGEHPYDRHFRRLLACGDLTDLAPQLHRLVKRLSSEAVPLDYAKLLRELNFWSAGYSERVKTDWAKEFWQAPFDLPAA
ncbi:MAG: type I-E CRISPR-associated protein Cse2/CasB [Luteolibacter sp.]|uniref:type I-E CRISPR-associated protein Cse2/CasB n=1 Tax=Luteolibacter sp. TaxID=1962973 RepID=UPI0032676312